MRQKLIKNIFTSGHQSDSMIVIFELFFKIDVQVEFVMCGPNDIALLHFLSFKTSTLRSNFLK